MFSLGAVCPGNPAHTHRHSPRRTTVFLYHKPAPEQESFDLSPLIPASKTSFLARPLHDWNMNDSGGVELGPRRRLFAFNMHTLAREDLEVLEASLDLTMHRGGKLHGLASWFDVGFAPAPVGKRLRTLCWAGGSFEPQMDPDVFFIANLLTHSPHAMHL
jgi:hypothetical protein